MSSFQIRITSRKYAIKPAMKSINLSVWRYRVTGIDQHHYQIVQSADKIPAAVDEAIKLCTLCEDGATNDNTVRSWFCCFPHLDVSVRNFLWTVWSLTWSCHNCRHLSAVP